MPLSGRTVGMPQEPKYNDDGDTDPDVSHEFGTGVEQSEVDAPVPGQLKIQCRRNDLNPAKGCQIDPVKDKVLRGLIKSGNNQRYDE